MRVVIVWVMSKPATAPASIIPGTGMSYTELCNTDRGSEARTMWSALGYLADAVGVPGYVAQIGPRTKTVDELVRDLSEVLPEGFDIAAAALATKAITPEVPTWDERWEVRLLTPNGMVPGEMHYITVGDPFPTKELAETSRDEHEATLRDAICVVVRVTTTVKTDVFGRSG